MRKIKLYIACSIDGYIARPDGELDWLSDYPITPEHNYGYDDFYKSVDTVILGGKTFRAILNMDAMYTYRDKTSFVITRNVNFPKTSENINYISNDIIETIEALKNQDGKDIWLVGGGQILSMLLDSNLIDEMTITTIPTILGNGIPLFPLMQKESKWTLRNTQSYPNGVVTSDYQIVIQILGLV